MGGGRQTRTHPAMGTGGLSDPLNQPQKEKGKGQWQNTNTQYLYTGKERMDKEPLATPHRAKRGGG